MRARLCLVLIALVLAGCNASPGSGPSPKPTVQDGSAAQSTRRPPPAGSQPAPTSLPLAAGATSSVPSAELMPGSEAGAYWVINSTSGARLAVRVYYPAGGAQSDTPAVLLVPGGTGTTEPGKARRLAEEGLVVVVFDPDGRGLSEGTEDFDGSIQQDGLAAVALASLTIPGVDPDRFGLVSYSYGITMASGALSRYPGLPLAFLIDWEGPADRYYTTSGCRVVEAGTLAHSCEDDQFWSEREAVNFIGDIRVPYQRIQSQTDHVQPTNAHAVDMVNAAVDGGVPWVRLNDFAPGETYDPANPPAMFPDGLDRELESKVAACAAEILSMLGR